MLTYGLLGAIRIASAAASASSTPGRGARRLGAFEADRRRPRRGGRARRTTPGTGRRRQGVSSQVRSRSSVAGQEPRARARRAAASRAVTAESGSPRRSACVRTRCRPRSRSPSRNQSSPPQRGRASRARCHVSPARPQPRSSSLQPGERVEDRVEVGRDVQAEHLDVVADVADRPSARPARARPRARARSGRRRRRRRAATTFTARPSAACVRGPARRPTRSRSSSVSTSSARFGIARDESSRARARARGSARRCPGRRAARTAAASGRASAFVVPSAASTSADARRRRRPPASVRRSVGTAQGTSALTTSTGARRAARARPRPRRPGRRPGRRRRSTPSSAASATRRVVRDERASAHRRAGGSARRRASRARARARTGSGRRLLPFARKGTTIGAHGEETSHVTRRSTTRRSPTGSSGSRRCSTPPARPRYAVRAYRRAAELVRSAPVAVAALVRAGRARELRGIGRSIEARLAELVETGELAEVASCETTALSPRTSRARARPSERAGRGRGCSNAGRRTALEELRAPRGSAASLRGRRPPRSSSSPERHRGGRAPVARRARGERRPSRRSVASSRRRATVRVVGDRGRGRRSRSSPAPAARHGARARDRLGGVARVARPLPEAEDEEAVFAALGLAVRARPSCARSARRRVPDDLLELERRPRRPALPHDLVGRPRVACSRWARPRGRSGYEYLAICDHTKAVRVVAGPRRRRPAPPGGGDRRGQRARWRRSGSSAGSSATSSPDGSLDLPDDVLAELEWVQISLHAGQRHRRGGADEARDRGDAPPGGPVPLHPKGRILGHRPENELDLDEVFAVCARDGRWRWR